MALQTGQIIDGKYRIIRELGSGSMGAVYEGENVRIKRRVAIKVLLPAVADRGDVVQRFEREAQAAGRIGSDHIVEVLDLGSLPDGGFYMVMEFLEGETLGARIKRSGRLEGRAIAPVAQQLLMGLEMAHEAKIIHRDLKPENVFLCREHAGQKDFVKILDFGVSKFNPLNDDEGMSMTRTGAVVGTPFYMAPEQAKGARDIDHRSDLYSVGVILYEAVTGQVPFHAGTFNELIFKIVLETPPPPEQFAPDMDPGFGRIVRKSMAREPTERYQTAAEFRDALYVWLHTGRGTAEPEEVRAPPIGPNVDWAAEKKTLLMQEGAGASTQIMDEPGAQTALLDPDSLDSDNATTRVMDADDDSNARTLQKPASQAPSRAKRPPPPPRSQRAPQRPAAGAPPPPAPAGAPPPPAPKTSLGYGAPTPVNRRPEAPSDWPTGVPKKRSTTLPIAIGVALTLAIGAGAAVLVLPDWSPAASASAETEEVDDDEPEDEEEETDTPAPETITHDEDAPTPGGPGDAAPGDAAPGDAASSDDRPAPDPTPAPAPVEVPRPAAAPPPRPRPAPPRVTPRPPPPPPPPPLPRPTGRKVETKL